MNPFLPRPTYIPSASETLALELIIGFIWLMGLLWLVRPVKK